MPYLEILIVGAVLSAGLTLLWLNVEPRRLEIDCFNLSDLTKLSRKTIFNVAAAPERTIKTSNSANASDCIRLRPTLRIAFFSDWHAGYMLVPQQKITAAATLLAQKADLCVFAGDLANSARFYAEGLADLALISKIMQRYDVPCLAVRGNHDAGLTAADFAAAGFRLLCNDSLAFSLTDGHPFLIFGADDYRLSHGTALNFALTSNPSFIADLPIHSGHSGHSAKETSNVIDNNVTTLLIAHNPDSILAMTEPPNYMIAGHFHGGQIYMPWHLEFKLLRHEVLGRHGLIRGVHIWQKSKLFISRGVGCVCLPWRFLSRPEFSLLEINLPAELTPEAKASMTKLTMPVKD